MKVNKSILGGSLCAIAALLIQFFLRAIDGTKYSTQITVTVLLIVGVSFAIGMICGKDKILGLKFNIIAAILMLLYCILESIDIIMNNTYPNLFKTNPLLSNTIDLSAVGSLLTFVLFLIIAGSITLKKNQ